MQQVVATFYKFVNLPDFAEKQAIIREFCQKNQIKGTILLAAEGINGTIAGSRQGIDAVLSFLRSDSRFADLESQESPAAETPFKRLKVRLKREIVTLGRLDVNPNEEVGTYVTPQDWNALISNPEVLLLDTRNTYEVAIGRFKGAVAPKTRSFRQFPDYVRQNLAPARQQKIVMYCTGGIRCEKASSFLLSQGFTEVYQLKGGILRYLAEIDPKESLWEGECFIFDGRIALKLGLEPGSHGMCRNCGFPLSEADCLSPQYQEGVSCPHCFSC